MAGTLGISSPVSFVPSVSQDLCLLYAGFWQIVLCFIIEKKRERCENALLNPISYAPASIKKMQKIASKIKKI
jgi:hypothetical protein